MSEPKKYRNAMIQMRRRRGESVKSIAELYHLTPARVYKICRGAKPIRVRVKEVRI
jgi:hypothetical protein